MAGEAKQGRKIVVAVDEGEESMYALSWCLQNVAAAGDTLVLLHAIQPRVVYSPMDGTGETIKRAEIRKWVHPGNSQMMIVFSGF